MTGLATPDARELIRRMARGDRVAFGDLYDRYARLVLSLALRIVHSQTDAEEVLQEVFWQAWRDAGRYDPNRGSPEAWLVTLARTRAIDVLRSARRVKERGGADLLPRAADPTPGAAERLEARELVVGALNGLSAPQREALELAYYEGLTQTEIAARTGAPLGTVKTRIRDGLARLRTALAAQGWTAS